MQHNQEQLDFVSVHREMERIEQSASDRGLDIGHTRELINLLGKRDSGQAVSARADAAARITELFLLMVCQKPSSTF